MKSGKYKFHNEIQAVNVWENKKEFIDHMKRWVNNYVDENDLRCEKSFNKNQIPFFIKSMNAILSERFYISIDEMNIQYEIKNAIKDNNNDKFIETLKFTENLSNSIKRNTTIL